jgi:intracellular sulfur oxidation DsrE/DsrF family protein
MVFVVTIGVVRAASSVCAAEPKLVTPVIPGVGGVVPLPRAAEPPRPGAKVVFDVTADSNPASLNKGLDRMARLLNLYGASGLKPTDVQIAVVFHGEATKTVLTDAAYQARFGASSNPNLPVLKQLRQAGVEVFVCGQALNTKGFDPSEVAEPATVAVAALTVVIHRQHDGYAYVLIP